MSKIWGWIKNNTLGIILAAALATVGMLLSGFIPYGLISGGVFALIIGMIFNPLVYKKKALFSSGINFTSKKLLKTAIVLMGVTLSFSQVLEVGKISLIVMSFTLVSAFGFGYLFGRLFKMNWKLSSLISAGTGICGGSAIAAISPVIDAKDSDIAYAISATFLFDILMVILFPIIGRAIGMTDMGFGLWAGTAVNDTSSVVAAGYAFSDIAGNYAVIVKLTRTLSIIPIVLIFSFINQRMKRKEKLSAAALSAAHPAVGDVSIQSVNSDVSIQLTNSEIALQSTKNIDPSKLNDSEIALQTSSGGTFLQPANSEIISQEANNKTVQPPDEKKNKLNLKKIFPYFILLFLAVVGIKSTGILPEWLCENIATASKFLMMMALGAIGLKTNFKSVAKSGFKPMLHGFIISALVVFVALGVQAMLGQL